MNPLAGMTNRLGRVGWLEAAFLVLLAVSLGMRLWELDGRAMHYDEAIHLYQSWQLANMVEYVHSPWMHGPLQIELTAVVFRLLGDTDTTARLVYALFGVALVAIPYFLRRHLGDWGALFTGVMLAASPALLYFARFGRNDILMAFWAAGLLALFWRYVHEERDRYLYLAAGLLALMFATKETAYFVTLTFGGIAFLLALPHWFGIATRREKLAGAAGPAGFFLLLFTLTLPQWSALGGLFQDLAGLDLISRDAGSTGIVGTPYWGGPELLLPVTAFHPAIHGLLAVIAVAAVGGWAWAAGFRRQGLAAAALPPLGILAAAVVLLARPVGVWAVDGMIALALAAGAAALLVMERRQWRGRLVLGIVAGRAGYGLCRPVYAVGQHGRAGSRHSTHRNQRGDVVQRNPVELRCGPGHRHGVAAGIRRVGFGLAGRGLADLRRDFLLGLAGLLHHAVHQLGRNPDRRLAKHGVLDCPAGRGAGQPTLVLLPGGAFGV